MKVARLGVIGTAAIALLLGSVGFIGTVAPASATSTVSTATINCGSASATVSPSAPIAAGDSLTINYTNCNGYDLSWTAFTFTSSSPFRENGNNTEARTLTNYSGSVADGTTLATLTKNTTTITITQASLTWTSKSPVSGSVGTTYNTSGYQFAASGATANSYTIASGSLPPGLTLSAAGLLSGTPTTVGTYTFDIGAGGVLPATTGNVTVTINGTLADKVTICHRTHATTNPYVIITVAVSSVIDNTGATVGHATHNSDTRHPSSPTGVFNPAYAYPANAKWWGDIIPPFTDHQTGRSYAGLNWSWGSPSSTVAPGDANNLWITKTNFSTAVGADATDATKGVSFCLGALASKTQKELFNLEVKNGQTPTDVIDEFDPVTYDPNQNLANSPTQSNKPTLADVQTVETKAPSSITDSTATLNGTLYTPANPWVRWNFEYGTDPNGTLTPTSSVTESTSGNKNTPVSGLTCNTTYYYRIVGVDNVPTSYYGEFKSFTTDRCPTNNGGGGNGGNGGNAADPTPTQRPNPRPTPSQSPTSNSRPPAQLNPLSSPTPTPTPTGARRPTPTPVPTTNPPVTLNPINTIPTPPGETLDPKSTKLLDPKTGTPTNTVVDDQGTWTVNPQSGSVTFTPAAGFVGTAVLKVQLSGRSGALYIQPMSVYVAARSRVLVLSGDVPKVIGAGRPGQLQNRK